jgi:tryptophan 2,3-dioxygenase
MPTTYWDYIRTEQLLALQGGLRDDDRELSNTEVLFIAVHQVFELWFKLVLRELVFLRDVLREDPVPETSMSAASRSLERVAKIFRMAAAHWELVETIDTRDYLEFRDALFPASGFQSSQLREIELLFGLEDAERIGLGKSGAYVNALRDARGAETAALQRVRARQEDRPNLREALDEWLWRTPIRGSQPSDAGDADVVRGFAEEYLAAHERAVRRAARAAGAGETLGERSRADVDAARAFLFPDDERRARVRTAILFIEGYRELPLLAWPQRVLERVLDAEQGMLVFRQRHARMVERIIGRRTGTGGSGLDYLDRTTTYRIFKDLWAARTFIVRKDDLPRVDPTPYGVRAT